MEMKLKKQEFLRRLEAAGESRALFARRCKLSRQAITAWINGERNPKPVNVRVMANALGCRIEDIAEPSTALETAAVKGDKFARSVIGIDAAPESAAFPNADAADIDRELLDFVEKSFAEQVRNGTQASLGKRIGLSAAQINRLAHGKAELSSLPIAVLSKLCPQLIRTDVLTGKFRPNASDVRPASSEGMFVPIISLAAAADCNPGLMPLLDCVNENSDDTAYFKQAKPGDFVIEVTGSSMSPWYPDGTLLLVRPYQELRNGQRVVAVLDDGSIIFKIYAEKGGAICLFSIDGEGKDYIFRKPRVPIRYICRVIASQRDEDDLDEEMRHHHVAHDWQRKLNEIADE